METRLLRWLLLVGFCGCSVNVEKGPIQWGKQGPENWSIDGLNYRLDSSYYLSLEREVVQYTLEHQCVRCASSAPAGERDANDVARKLIRHAYLAGKHKRGQFSGGRVASRIGVLIVRQDGGRRVEQRVSLGLDEIAALP